MMSTRDDYQKRYPEGGSTLSRRRKPGSVFPTAAEDLLNARADIEKHEPSAQVASSAYRLAFDDPEFLLREEMRGVRLMLELTKPEMIMRQHNVENTIVMFGSARTPRPDMLAAEEEQLRIQMEIAPDNPSVLLKKQRFEFMRWQSTFYEEARKLAALVTTESQKGDPPPLHVITGGGPGIMEAANRGAMEAGGKSIGLNIVLPHEQNPNPYITPEFCFQFHYFAMRKMHFLVRARALVVFPGGFGTLDELFETLTLVQTGKVMPMPILVFGREFWERLIDFNYMVEQGVISQEDLNLFRYVDTAEEAWEMIREGIVSGVSRGPDVPPPVTA
jgi:uncharacterized protein (TIGR00730 family)